MSQDSFQEPQSSTTGLSRRQFVQRVAGGAVAAGAAITTSATSGAGNSVARGGGKRPNIVLIITDQERYPQYWPPGWAEENLPNRKRLADHGLTFTHAFCNAAMCSPSRATLFTGLYLTQHGVEHTLTSGGCLSPDEPTLQPTTQNMARLLASAGYNVQYRGKCHLTKDVTSLTDASSSEDVGKLGFQGWQPPEAAQDTNPAHFGAGCTGYDRRWAQQAVDFLQSKEAKSEKPFALIVSFANPHDALSYPSSWNQGVGPNRSCTNYADDAPQAFHQGISLPPTFNEELELNFKPQAQVDSLALLDDALGRLSDSSANGNDFMNYVNFYAYLQTVVDKDIGTVVDALEANPSLYDKTFVIRVSDHGEMGLSHGGLRQKVFNAYEESIRVPMVFSNPVFFPNPVQTNALASLVDIMPTLATLADVPNRDQWDFKGNDLSPIIMDAVGNPANPTASVQDSILFMYDDDNPGAANPQPFVKEPSHIRCVRDERYKYAVYFDPCGVEEPQHELYDLLSDCEEQHNMADPLNTKYFDPVRVLEMQAKLEARMTETGVNFTPWTPYCSTPDGCNTP